MEHGTKSIVAVLATLALGACGNWAEENVRGSAAGTRAGEGLSAAARGGITTHGAAPGPGTDSRPDYDDEGDDVATILPTPRVHIQPYHPEPVGETGDGLEYRTWIDVTNRGGIAVRVPHVDLDVEMRMAEGRRGCEVESISTIGPPTILPGETVRIDARSVCPATEDPHEVVALVELPELTGDDGLVAGRAMVVDADPIR